MTPFFVPDARRRIPRKKIVRRLALEQLEERCLLAPYDGTYTGTYTGTEDLGDGHPKPVSGQVSFSVTNSQKVTATAPAPGGGEFTLGGGIHFETRFQPAPAVPFWTFDGNITLSGGTATARGTWGGLSPNAIGWSGQWSASTGTVAPVTVTPTSLVWNKATGLANYGYQVSNDLTRDVTNAFYWGSDSVGSATIGAPFYSITAGRAHGSYTGAVPSSKMIGAPANAKYLLMITDPGNTLGNFDPNQNVKALPLVLNVTRAFYQNEGNWKNEKLGNVGDGPSSDTITIGRFGCTLTTLTMMLNYNNIFLDPLGVNNLLKHTAAFGGERGASLIFPTAPQIIVAAKAPGSKLHWVPLKPSGDPQVLRDTLLTQGQPVMVKVQNFHNSDKKYHDHYVLVTGLAGGNDFTIIDPGPYNPPRTRLSTYSAKPFEIQGYLHDPVDLSALVVADSSGAALTVRDPSGNADTVDPASGRTSSLIPNSFTHFDGPLEDVTEGPDLPNSVASVQIDQPRAGSYQIQLNGKSPPAPPSAVLVTPIGFLQPLQPSRVPGPAGGPAQYQVVVDPASLRRIAAKIGVERPAADGSATLSLDSLGNGNFGPGDAVFTFGLATDTFLVGDWTGVGFDSIGVVRPTASGVAQFALDTNGNDAFDAGDSVFNFGLNTDTFLTGDWNGDSRGKIGVVRPGADGVPVFSLDTNGDGAFDAGDTVTKFGLNGDTFVIGDWNGDGKAKIGVVRSGAAGAAVWSLDTNGDGVFDAGDSVFKFGLNTDTFVVGDWNGDGRTKIGVVRPGANGVAVFALDTNGDGQFDANDSVFSFGLNSDKFLIGRWKPPSSLRAAGGALDNLLAPPLALDANFMAVVNQAVAAWRQAGLDPADVARLQHLNFGAADLGGDTLGLSSGDGIVLDATAAGYGWSEGAAPEAGKVDLFTALAHEMGHTLGLGEGTTDQPSDVMFESLLPGTRKAPTTQDVDTLFATLGRG